MVVCMTEPMAAHLYTALHTVPEEELPATEARETKTTNPFQGTFRIVVMFFLKPHLSNLNSFQCVPIIYLNVANIQYMAIG